MKQHLARIAQLRDQAKKGDKEALKELVKLCRRGMLEPYWEGAP